VSKKKRWDKGI